MVGYLAMSLVVEMVLTMVARTAGKKDPNSDEPKGKLTDAQWVVELDASKVWLKEKSTAEMKVVA